MNNQFTQVTPWVWVPTLYFAEGVPYFVVNNISVMMFTKMGVPNGDMAFFTTLLYFPWFLKGIWSPLVDVVRTKRWWIVTMQAVLTILLALLTLTLPSPSPALIASGHTPISMFTLTVRPRSSASEARSTALPRYSDRACWCSSQAPSNIRLTTFPSPGE